MNRIARFSRILIATAAFAVPGIALAQQGEVDRDRVDMDRRDRGFDFGWLGLLGLGGLAGLMGRDKTTRYNTDVKHATGRV